ncbi:conodipine-P1-like [Gigantopelta aegis]|uniref:conodipine-P1-like n=1 Tax=Gigantopelta aegis TaxID=1735272 RepID=UPI001B8884C0|nr:conodipine-P1-like [Gigantopelta aegis]
MSSLFYICVFVGIVACAAALDCNHGVTDGCSIPLGMPFFYKSRFRHACDKHDICYHCGVSHGVSKHQCDVRLYHNAISVCHSAGKRFIFDMDAVTKQFCDSIAKAYYSAVNIFGSGSYHNSPDHYCHSSWVPHCI